jgi:ATP-dependent DNA helicase PIF1
MEYENERARGNNYRQQQQQQSSSGIGRVRRPAVPGMASSVAPYSPPGGRGGGGGSSNSASYSRDSNATAARLDLEQLAKSMQNLPSTVSLAPSDAAGLGPEQRRVVEAVLSGHSVFFTGPAGSGKSHVLSTIVRLLEDGRHALRNPDGQPRKIAITATTGIAACNVGGITINSFAGVGTAEGPVSDMCAKVMGNEYSKKRWREHDILVIDEVSMMPGQFLDKLNFVAQRVRNNRSVFGGMQ